MKQEYPDVYILYISLFIYDITCLKMDRLTNKSYKIWCSGCLYSSTTQTTLQKENKYAYLKNNIYMKRHINLLIVYPLSNSVFFYGLQSESIQSVNNLTYLNIYDYNNATRQFSCLH